jgi:hypothetical protein
VSLDSRLAPVQPRGGLRIWRGTDGGGDLSVADRQGSLREAVRRRSAARPSPKLCP